jgi:hypothetical protein
MHIHANPLAVQAANFHSSQFEAEIEARRAADVRRRLSKVSTALAVGTEQSPEETLLISHWMGTSAPSAPVVPSLGGDEYHPSSQNGDDYPIGH